MTYFKNWTRETMQHRKNDLHIQREVFEDHAVLSTVIRFKKEEC